MLKFLGDTIFITIGGLINRLKGLIFIPFIIAVVGLESYGAFVQILVTIKLGKSLGSLGLGMGFQRFASALDNEEKDTLSRHFSSIFFPTLIFGLVGSGLVFLAAPWINEWFLDGKYLESMQVVSLMILAGAMYENNSKFLLARKHFKAYSILTLLSELGPYLAFMGGIVVSGTLFYGMLSYLLASLMVGLIILIFILRKVSLRRPSSALFKQYLGYTYPLAISSIEGGLLDKIDRFFVSFFWGNEVQGLYHIIYSICSLLDFVTVPIRKQIMSYLPKAWDKGFVKETIQTIRYTLLFYFLVTVGMLAVLINYVGPLLKFLAREEAEVAQLEWIVAIIGLGILANASQRFYQLVINLNKTTIDQIWYQMAGVLTNILLNWLLVPRYGMMGAALATLLAYGTIIILINLKYKIGLDSAFFGHLLSFGLIALSSTIFVKLIPPDQWILFFVSAGLAYLTYLGLIYLTKKRLLNEVKDLLQEFRKIA